MASKYGLRNKQKGQNVKEKEMKTQKERLSEELNRSMNPTLSDIYASVENFRYKLKAAIFMDDTISETDGEHYADINLPGMPYLGQRFWLCKSKNLKGDCVCRVKDIDVSIRFFGGDEYHPCVSTEVHLTRDTEYYKSREEKDN